MELKLSTKNAFQEGREYDHINTAYVGKKILSTFNIKKNI